MKFQRWTSQILAWAAAIGVLVPIFVRGSDDFPFSSYPMFTSDRAKVELTVMLHSEDPKALLQGERVPPDWISGEEVMMAMTTIRSATWGGVPGMTRLCDDVRRQAASRGKTLQALGFVVESMDVLAQVQGVPQAHGRRLVFLCPQATEVQ